MIQINLLPDVKAVYVKAQRTKRTVITLAAVISGVAIGFVLLLSSVAYGAQKLKLSSTENSINNDIAKIQETPDLDKILTIQNQLIALTPLHDSKPEVYKLFEYIEGTTPANIRIDTLNLNVLDNTISVGGTAPNLEAVNTFVDTLKFTLLVSPDQEESADDVYAFSNVVLVGFDTSASTTEYTISMNYNPQLFSMSNGEVKLKVPKLTTTRSELEQPTELFKENKNDNSTGENN